MTDIYTLKLDRTLTDKEFNDLLVLVSPEKENRIRRFHHIKDSQRSLLGDVLSRYAINKRTGLKNKDLIFVTNEYGKPLLKDQHRLHFNISHSGIWVVCAVDNTTVGIDVEEIKPIDFVIAERFFSNEEYLDLMSKPQNERLMYFYMLWTLKESYIKSEGKGLSIPLNSFYIKFKNRFISASDTNGIIRNYFCQSFLDDTYIYAICTTHNNINNVVCFSIDQFIREYNNSNML